MVAALVDEQVIQTTLGSCYRSRSNVLQRCIGKINSIYMIDASLTRVKMRSAFFNTCVHRSAVRYPSIQEREVNGSQKWVLTQLQSIVGHRLSKIQLRYDSWKQQICV